MSKRMYLCHSVFYDGVLYRPGDNDLPDALVDMLSLRCSTRTASGKEIRVARSLDSAEPEPSTEESVLALINSAATPAELTVLPSIGTVSATAILDNRPVAGYADRAEVELINAALTQVRWDEVFAFELT